MPEILKIKVIFHQQIKGAKEDSHRESPEQIYTQKK